MRNVPNLLCPLCRIGHFGKCPKKLPDIVWCGQCLIDSLLPNERQVTVGDAKLEPDQISALGARRTGEFCYRCGAPACEIHGTRDKAGGWVCAGAMDCRDRRLKDVDSLRIALDIYSPKWNTGGKRCKQCNLPRGPGSAKGFCRRHYAAWKKGRPLHEEAARHHQGSRREWVRVGIPVVVLPEVNRCAAEDGYSTQLWIFKVLEEYLTGRLAKEGRVLPKPEPIGAPVAKPKR